MNPSFFSPPLGDRAYTAYFVEAVLLLPTGTIELAVRPPLRDEDHYYRIRIDGPDERAYPYLSANAPGNFTALEPLPGQRFIPYFGEYGSESVTDDLELSYQSISLEARPKQGTEWKARCQALQAEYEALLARRLGLYRAAAHAFRVRWQEAYLREERFSESRWGLSYDALQREGPLRRLLLAVANDEGALRMYANPALLQPHTHTHWQADYAETEAALKRLQSLPLHDAAALRPHFSERYRKAFYEDLLPAERYGGQPGAATERYTRLFETLLRAVAS